MAKPTFRYNGGKATLANRIAALLVPADRYVDPFVGRGNLYFYVASHGMYSKYWLNDKLLRFVHSISMYGDWLPVANMLHGVDGFKEWDGYRRIDEAHHEKSKGEVCECGEVHADSTIYASPAYILDVALAFSGGTYDSGPGGRDPARSGAMGLQDRVREAAAIIKRTQPEITCLDWREVLAQCGADDMVYLDPPYRLAEVSAYSPLPEEDYAEMIEILLEAKFKWALSEYDDPNYQPLTEKFGEPMRFEVRAQMTSNGKREPRVECVWRNYR